MTALIPDFITIAHSKMMRGDKVLGLEPLRIDDMLTEATLTLAAGSVALPSDYLQRKSLYVDDACTTALTFLPLERWYRNALEGQAGVPKFYTLKASTLLVAPYSSDDVKFNYYTSLDQMTDDSDTNILFTKAPHAYLYGALFEAYSHIRQLSYAQNYGALFASAVNSLNGESRDHEYAGDQLTMMPESIY